MADREHNGPEDETERPGSSNHEDLLTEIRAQFDRDQDAVDAIREEQADDLGFYAGDQWDENIKEAREALFRPCLTVDHIAQHVRQVTGDMRMNKPAIKVLPVDGGADKDTAELLTGLIRNIEQQSNATSAYVRGGENATICGEGAWRLVTEYAGDDTFDQEVRIKRINNALSVIWDRDAQEPTREDAQHCFVTSEFSKEAFKEKYPGAAITSFETRDYQDWFQRWYRGNDITVAEYWYKKPVKRKLWRMFDGKVLDVTKLTSDEREELRRVQGELAASQGLPAVEIAEREAEGQEIWYTVVNGAEVLEEPQLWPGSFIPIIPVFGEEIYIGTELRRRGLVRQAKDPQRMLNFHESAAVETVALAPKAPWLVTEKHVQSHRDIWERANTDNLAFLPHTPDPAMPNGPRREPPAPVPAALMALRDSASRNVSSAMGIYPESALGANMQGPQQSGRAILQRDRQGDVGSYLYLDNLDIAVAYTGRQLVDLIPKVYDGQRMVRILGEDEAEELVEINVMQPDGSVAFDMSVGKYDVVTKSGPSFSTKRVEAAESMMEFLRTSPQMAGTVIDLIAKNMDWPGADEFEERFRRMMIAQGSVEADPERGEQPPAQQGPDPIMQAMAEAELGKAQADLKTADAKAFQTMAQAQKTAADTTKVYADARGQRLDNMEQTLALLVGNPQFQALMQAQIEAQIRQMLANASPYGPNGAGYPPA